MVNSILSRSVQEIEPGLYSALPECVQPASYDRRAAMYDAVLSLPFYHRLAWGASIQAYARFATEALKVADTGHFAEVGCGSLLFSAGIYKESHAASALLVDRSIGMLQRGLRRIRSQGVSTKVVLLQADGGSLPVHAASLTSILSMNLLHVPCERRAVVAEFRRTLVPGQGRVFVSALVRSGRWSDGYLKMLHRAGELDTPMTREDLAELLTDGWGTIESMSQEGNMAFAVVRHSG